MAKHRSIFYDALLLTGANLMMRGVSLAFQAYLVGRIGAGGIGLLTLVGTVGMLAETVGGAGSRVATTCLVAEEYGYRRMSGVRRAMTACLKYALFTSSLIGLLTTLTANPIAMYWLGDERTTNAIRITGLTLPLSCIWGVLSSYFTATGRVGRLVAIKFADRIVDIAATALLLTVWAGSDVERGCMSIVGGSAIGTGFSILVLYSLYRFDHWGNDSEQTSPMWRRLFGLTLPLTLSDSLRAGLNTMEQFLIPWGLRRSGASGESAIATYGVIHGMVFPVLMFPACVLNAISDLLVPELSRRRALEQTERIRRVVRQCLHWGLIFAAAVAGVLWIAAMPLTDRLYHSVEAGKSLKLFAPLVFLLYMDTIVDGMLKGLLQQVHSARYNTITSVMDVVLLFLLLPRWGISGYFVVFTVTHTYNFYLSITRLIRVTDYSPDWGFALRLILAVAAAVAVSLHIAGELAGLAYLPLLALALRLSGAVDSEELRWLLGIVTRRVKAET